MPQLPKTLTAWGTADFAAALEHELCMLGAVQLPLQAGLAHTGYALDEIRGVMLLDAEETATQLLLKVGVFYAGIIAGCNCADDPTPVEPQEEYCELHLEIDRADGAATVRL